jgi:DNA-binding NarL/FixJ family response regulator
MLMGKIRVLIADDHDILRQGIIALLDKHDIVEVVGEASDGRDAVAQAKQLNPDVVIMDISMPLMDGVEATRRLRKSHPKIKILMLTIYGDKEKVQSSVKAGAAGYVPKVGAGSDLVSAIEAVHRGDYFVHPSVAKVLFDRSRLRREDDPYDRLTNREREIIRLIADGWTSHAIADSLSISVKTVLGHRTKIMGKLDIHSRTELVKYAIRKGITSVDA